jgi:hypothetical protein
VPYHAVYEEPGWREDISEAKWALIPVPFAVLGFVAVTLVYRSNSHLGSGGIRGHSGIDGRTAYGGLATLMTLLLSLVGIATGVALALTTRHRVRKIATFGAACSTTVLGVLIGFALATA